MKLLFRITPKGAFYKGNGALDASNCPFPRSDTLFHAITKAWGLLWGNEEEKKLVLECKKADMPFSISSIFPAVGDVYFLPKPMALKFTSGKSKKEEKNTKQISWISAAVYKEWLENKKVSLNFDSLLSPSLYCSSKEMESLNALNIPSTLWSDDNGRMRNLVNLSRAEAKTYPANQIFYGKSLDLYFLADVRDDYKEKLEASMRLLADEGIGGERSVGCGAFSYQVPASLPESLQFIGSPVQDAFVTLSLFYPDTRDLQNGLLKNAFFELLERQGWSSDDKGVPHRQKSVNLFKEGSYFRINQINPVNFVDVTPPESGEGTFCHYSFPFRIVAPVEE